MMVWLGYVTARTIAPERMDLRIGVPLLLAFIPQNVFYAMNNDVLSPLCFGALFLCVLQWLRTNAPSLLLGALTGLAVAATCLTKLSNLPLVAVALAVIVARSMAIILRTPRAGLIALAALISCAAIPIGTWMLWTEISFWRSHRIDSENWFARLDAKTVRRLVAASDFHAARCLDFLVGFNRELLARGSSVGMVGRCVGAGPMDSTRFLRCFFLPRLLSGCENRLDFPRSSGRQLGAQF